MFTLDIPCKSIDIPNMSNNPNELLGECLFGKVRRKVLATFVLNPERSFYLLELIRLLDCGRGAVQREVARLSRAGILYRTRIGNQVHYSADMENLIFQELRSIFSKTTGLIDLLTADLKCCRDTVGMAFIYGDYASGTAVDNSPVNLLVIGDTSMDAVKECTAAFAKSAGRKLHIIVLPASELKKRVSSSDRRIQEILSDRKIFLAGGQRELQILTTPGDDLFAGIF